MAITAIKTAIDIAKTINEADKLFEKAELKLKIAELMEVLAKAKTDMILTQELIQDKDAEIQKLEKLLSAKQSSQTDALPDECISILKLLSRNFEYPIAQHIASELKISTHKAQYFLDILKTHKLLTERTNYQIGKVYNLNELGRKFLVEKGLL